jgi:hypothetical protein
MGEIYRFANNKFIKILLGFKNLLGVEKSINLKNTQ